MKTDVDTCIREIADWYIQNRREITKPELEAILWKHCEDEAEVQKFIKFLETEPGQMRFKTIVREKQAVEYPYHGIAYGFEGEILETDDFQYLPSLDSLRQWAVVIAKRIHGEQGGYGPGLKMPVDNIVITGPSGLHRKWLRWDLFRLGE